MLSQLVMQVGDVIFWRVGRDLVVLEGWDQTAIDRDAGLACQIKLWLCSFHRGRHLPTWYQLSTDMVMMSRVEDDFEGG